MIHFCFPFSAFFFRKIYHFCFLVVPFFLLSSAYAVCSFSPTYSPTNTAGTTAADIIYCNSTAAVLATYDAGNGNDTVNIASGGIALSSSLTLGSGTDYLAEILNNAGII